MQSILTYTIELVAIAFILLLALDLFATISSLLQAVQPVNIYYQRLTLDNVPNRLDYLALILALSERE
ncbi:hypothetical protein ACF3DV_22770 [Chlorogloeopsis fritschii PCC 9212]|uniref:Uncharacterized protein n=1 Tax=Chlorogloeopsis fritschii PCC 6912 TaxID=211165 RepID=A0A3S1FAB6_CHLFR|nr:hypothetical protein [Chlorogloeopsis fritschii]MBF2004512.1 hypothetical protein [Chlorogloeopsis fritschii C42_A2020_084]RUR74052.1 hypothetical protein PCC6912_53600 [Chlorogloeopsis fritschii PCC 6912]